MAGIVLTFKNVFPSNFYSKGKCLLSSNLLKLSSAQRKTICHKDNIHPEVAALKGPAWPYKTKKWTAWHMRFGIDPTTYKFDENSVIISIEGNIASGKSEFGPKLAEQLGMMWIPHRPLEDIYKNIYEYDYRSLNKYIPEEAHFMDLKTIFHKPSHPRVGFSLTEIFRIRYYDYIRALAHVFSTGEGVVIERSPWTDIIFLRSLWRMGYIHRELADFYFHLCKNTLWMLMRPHLVIYLDITPEEALARINEKNDPDLKGSFLMQNTKFLEQLDIAYKEQALPNIEKHAEVLTYDWSKVSDLEMIVDDIEKLNYEQYSRHGEKTEDWRLLTEIDFDERRVLYTSGTSTLLSYFNQPTYDIHGMDFEPDVSYFMERVQKYMKDKPFYYQEGFCPEKDGFWNVLFKLKTNYRSNLDYEWFPYKNSYSPAMPDE